MRRDPRQKAYRGEKHRNAGNQCDSLSLVMTKRNNYNKEKKGNENIIDVSFKMYHGEINPIHM